MSDLALTVSGPAEEKSAIRKWAEKTLGGVRTLSAAKVHAVEGARGLRTGAESLAVGAGLGALHAELKTGLDVDVGGKKVPVDGVGGIVALAASVAVATHPGMQDVGPDLRNAGGAALAVFGFRKGNEFMAEKKLQGGAAPGGKSPAHGESDEESDYGADPIVALARSMT